MLKYEVFTNLFQSLEQKDDVSNEMYELSGQFLCTLYGHKENDDVNVVRYKMYCAKRDKCEANQMPSCISSLRQHVQRANYQILLRADGKLEIAGHLRLIGWIVNQHLMKYS